MFLSMNWISDFVDLTGLDKMELISRFSLSTAEVENEIFHKGSDISGIVVAEIKEVADHPDSKKLHLLKVDAGDGALTDVVCGAPNVKVGMKTAFAKVGAKIGEIEITPRPVAGITSYGMCCSEKEIGISDDHEGIMEILDDAPCGTDLKELYEIDDIIFEVDNKSLTNRPDLWGHYGIAREFAALAGRELKPLDCIDLAKYDGLPKVDMKIEDKLCQRYSCMQVENITKTVSPVNMRIRLYYCGMRGINLLADLTNYLMLEMGQPMHAFDSRKVEKLRIKRFDKPFTFQTLDGIERNIDENTLMICNDDTPVAIAGIMGGLDSEIVDDTTTLTLESATFDAVSIRKSTVRLAHRTDASMRYEKCLDPEMTVTAIGRFLKLLMDIDGGVKVVSSLTDEYAVKYDTVNLAFDKKFDRDFVQVGTDMANKIASIVLPINPLESTANGLSLWDTMLYTALPSTLQFWVQNATNTDWKGAPLQKEYTYNEDDPQWMKAFNSNPKWMRCLSKWCNENINPDGDFDGWDWSPEKLDNTLSNLFGGVYSMIKQTGRTIATAMSEDKDFRASSIPLVGTLFDTGINDDDRFVTDAYFDMKDYYDANVNSIKRTAKNFGYDLEEVFGDEPVGTHHPRMQKIYKNRNFDFMQEWYKGNKELESLSNKIKRKEKKLAGMENAPIELVEEIANLKSQYETERREFVNDMLELD